VWVWCGTPKSAWGGFGVICFRRRLRNGQLTTHVAVTWFMVSDIVNIWVQDNASRQTLQNISSTPLPVPSGVVLSRVNSVADADSDSIIFFFTQSGANVVTDFVASRLLTVH